MIPFNLCYKVQSEFFTWNFYAHAHKNTLKVSDRITRTYYSIITMEEFDTCLRVLQIKLKKN